MTTLSRRPRLLATIVVAAALVGLAAGIAVARGGSKTAAGGPAGVVSQGTFRTITWGTTGTATVVRDTSGHLKVRLSKSFTTRRGPDVWVYLAKYEGSVWRGRRVEWKLIGHLRRASGRQEYDLPAEAARPGMSIAIFCGECGRLSGIAQLEPARVRA
jgi:Electron transfer DM13